MINALIREGTGTLILNPLQKKSVSCDLILFNPMIDGVTKKSGVEGGFDFNRGNSTAFYRLNWATLVRSQVLGPNSLIGYRLIC